MLRRLVVFAIAMYLLADFCDAGMPGAFNFSADDSVEVVHIEKPQVRTNPLRDPRPELWTSHIHVMERMRMAQVRLVVASATTAAPDPPPPPLRARSTQLSSEDSTPASLAF